MTLKDIAKLAGVSPMTVSNVINGKTARVSPATMEKVNAIIEEYHYIPNLNARNLTNHNSNIVAVIITDYSPDPNLQTLDNPYLSTMIGIIEQELRKRDYYTMICSSFDESDIVTLLKNWNPAGIMTLYPIFGEKSVEIANACSCPVVMFDNDIAPDNTIHITSDDKRGLYVSTKYLINKGHRRIAFVGAEKGSSVMYNRYLGYVKALEENNIPLDEKLVFHGSPTYEGGISAGRQIAALEEPVTGVVCCSDICAVGLMEGARLGGLRIPHDLSVIGYDNLSICNYTTPKLTSISQNVEDKAKKAIDLLIHAINHGIPEEVQNYCTSVEVVERQSVATLN